MGERRLSGADLRDRRKQVQLGEEDDDQQGADEELGHGARHQGRNRDRMIGGTPRPQRGEGAEHQGEGHEQRNRDRREDEAVAKRGADHAPHRLFPSLDQRGRGVPEMARTDIGDECEVTLRKRVIQVEVGPHGLDPGGGRVFAQHDGGDVTGQDLDRGEDEERGHQQRDDPRRNPPDDESSNGVSLLPAPRPVTVGRAARGCRWCRSREAAHAARRQIRFVATRT